MHIIPVLWNRAHPEVSFSRAPWPHGYHRKNFPSLLWLVGFAGLEKMGNQNVQQTDFALRATSGPTAVSFPLSQPGPIVIGRMSCNELQLNNPSVSRQHARLTHRPPQESDDPPHGEWLLSDLGSSRGTWLNGVKLNPNDQCRIRIGDLIIVGPWTLMVANPALPVAPGTAKATISDDEQVGTVVATNDFPPTSAALPQQELQLLLECSELIQEARAEQDVLQIVLDAIVAGTGFTRAAFLRPPTGNEVAEVVAAKGYDEGQVSSTVFSRALIHEASSGAFARLQRGPAKQRDASAPSDDTVVALCIPVMAGSTLTGFYYLDQPSNDPPGKWMADRGVALPMGLARLSALGLSNLMRIDVERRQLQMEAEVKFATVVQRWLLPSREGSVGRWAFSGETRQGKYIRGDFFDVVSLSDDRVAVVVGDVLGRGIPVSVLVSASQGFLHACLEQAGDPVKAVEALHQFLRVRVLHSRFVKLWIGVLDAAKQELSYAVAGQGHALIMTEDGTCLDLSTDRFPLAGTKHAERYEAQTVPFAPCARLLVVSDGMVNQRPHAIDVENQGTDDDRTDVTRPFGLDGVRQCLRSCGGENEVSALFAALARHAADEVLDDDATVVMVRQAGSSR